MAIKTSPPAIVSGLTLAGNTTTGLANYNHSAIYVILIIIALPKLKQSFKEWRDK